MIRTMKVLPGEGIPRNCYQCPIAVAIKRATGSNAVRVDMRSASIDGEYFKLSVPLQLKIAQIDYGPLLSPFMVRMAGRSLTLCRERSLPADPAQ